MINLLSIIPNLYIYFIKKKL